MGTRRVVPIVGGTFSGPLLSGRILEGGADWQWLRPDTVAEIDARYTLMTDGGAVIDAKCTGYRHGPPDVMAQVARGISVDPSAYYFRTLFRFETGDPELEWLSRSLFIGTGAKHQDGIVINVYAVR